MSALQFQLKPSCPSLPSSLHMKNLQPLNRIPFPSKLFKRTIPTLKSPSKTYSLLSFLTPQQQLQIGPPKQRQQGNTRDPFTLGCEGEKGAEMLRNEGLIWNNKFQ
uniref:Uncharacterized protein n=1 Tax=Salix viminalis TaxID=40686 RepID=A0A6N2MB97_SALVM